MKEDGKEGANETGKKTKAEKKVGRKKPSQYGEFNWRD
jgi:hypothetical protein